MFFSFKVSSKTLLIIESRQIDL